MTYPLNSPYYDTWRRGLRLLSAYPRCAECGAYVDDGRFLRTYVQCEQCGAMLHLHCQTVLDSLRYCGACASARIGAVSALGRDGDRPDF